MTLIRKARYRLRLLLIAVAVIALDGGKWVVTEQGGQYQPSFLAHAQTSGAIASELLEALQNPEVHESVIAALGVPPNQQPIYRDHLQQVWGNTAIRQAFVVDAQPLISTLDLSNPNHVYTIARNFSSAWFQEKALSGLNRLAIEDVREFAKFMRVFMTSVTTQQCAQMIRNEMSAVDMANLEVQVMNRMPASFVRAYLGITRKSVIAEVSDFPLARTMGISERMVVEEVLGNKLLNAFDAHPNGEQLLLGLESLEYLSNDELCEFNNLVIDIIIDGNYSALSARQGNFSSKKPGQSLLNTDVSASPGSMSFF